MGSNSTATEQITVRIVVDTEENRVLYAEAGKDFVDVLLSFLTLPLGTIARLVDKDSNMKPLRLGCISSLYQSVGNLDPKYWNSETCKQMLLRPRNSMEFSNGQLKLNIDDTEPTKFYFCEQSLCRRQSHMLVSTFNNTKCKCGRNLTRELFDIMCEVYTGEGYVREAPFVVYDDLHVMPLNLTSTLCLLKTLRSKDKIEDFVVNIDPKEVMDLLRYSLVSSTVLTDSLLRRKQIVEDPKGKAFKNTNEILGREDIRMKLNIMIEKSKFKVLFAIVDDDFMEQLLSFLAIPLGAVERVLQGNSGLGCIDKLYNSLTCFESTDFISGDNMLADLKFAPQYKLKRQMLPISEMMYPSPLYYYDANVRDYKSIYLTDECTTSDCNSPNQHSLAGKLWDPKQSSTTESSYGYVKRPTMFVVADDLTVKPFSSGLVVSCLNKEANSKVSEHDLEERTICVGVREVVNILKASLISTSALTTGLAQFLTNTAIKEEK